MLRRMMQSVFVCVFARACVCLHVRVSVCACMSMYVLYACKCVFVCVHVRMCVIMCAPMCIIVWLIDFSIHHLLFDHSLATSNG